MIPASRAAASASPFGRLPRRLTVSGAVRSRPRATARRRTTGLAPTSTMRSSPDSSTCERSLTAATLAHAVRCAIQILELGVDPRLEIVVAHVCADLREPLAARLHGQLERLVQRLRLAGHVERVDGDHPVAELLVGTGVLGED